jgi:hypothetical protein
VSSGISLCQALEVDEQRLPGGNAGGALLVDGTVRRATGPWTPAVHALLDHLESTGFPGAPRVLGIDHRGREMLTFLPGQTVGDDRPWPEWVHSDEALVDVGRWLRRYHDAVSSFVPPVDAQWRTTQRRWRPGDVIGHNDAAPYNAVWAGTDGRTTEPDDSTGRLLGFIDWDFAGPCTPLWDLAFAAFSWVPLHARTVVVGEGFTAFAERPRRLRLLLDAYGYHDTIEAVLDAVRARVAQHARDVIDLAAGGNKFFSRMVADGTVDRLQQALVQLEGDTADFLDCT